MEEISKKEEERIASDLKIIILGNISTGKTSIINRYIKETFDEKCRATVGVNFSSKIEKVNGIMIRIHFWDLPGQDRNAIVTNIFSEDTDGIIFCCEVKDDKSKQDIKQWVEAIKKNIDIENIPKILIENKCDLLGEENKYNENMEDLNKIVENYKLSKCFRTSALNGYNIDNALKFLINEIMETLDNEDIKTLKENHSDIKLDNSNNKYKNKNQRCC